MPIEPSRTALTPRIRILLLTLMVGVQLLYVPLNRTITGGVILLTPWDRLVPFWPLWAIPYALCIPWWAASFAWAASKMDDSRLRAFVVASIVVMASSYLIYMLFPTYIQRPMVAADSSWRTAIIRYIYANDRLNNAFPSGHTYLTMLIVLFWWDWYPRFRVLWVLCAIVVVLSTLFTGQHNLPDPIGGIIWAWAGTRFGWWVEERRKAMAHAKRS